MDAALCLSDLKDHRDLVIDISNVSTNSLSQYVVDNVHNGCAGSPLVKLHYVVKTIYSVTLKVEIFLNL